MEILRNVKEISVTVTGNPKYKTVLSPSLEVTIKKTCVPFYSAYNMNNLICTN